MCLSPRAAPLLADEIEVMSKPNAQAYLRTKVLTASPAELRLLLIDGAIRFAQTMRDGLEVKDHEKIYEGSSNCRAIKTL